MRCGNSLSTMKWSLAAAGVLLLAPVALAQDECSSAVSVTAGQPASFSTLPPVTASSDPVDASQCASTFLDWGTGNPDVWFRWVAPADGTASFSTCLSGSFDTSMVLYKGTSCTNKVQVACNGDGAGGTSCQPFYSRIADFAVLQGEVFYIRIGGWNGEGVPERGSGALTVSFVAAGDPCGLATGECGEAHGGLGCNVPACCAEVCAVAPLCCEIAWDADCVQVAAAVEICGVFLYSCPTPPGPQPNDCAPNATVITASGSRAFSNIGATMDGPDHPASTCSSGNDSFFNDLWYRVPVIANGTLKVETCNAVNFDSKLAIYNMGTNPASFDFNSLPSALVGCNDDGDEACQATAPFASSLSAAVAAGNTYLVRLATYDSPGSGTVTFTVPVPCQLDAVTESEAEPCGSSANNGCVTGGNGATQSIQLGSTVAGTFWADGNSRDVDYYKVSIATDTLLTVSIKSASFARALILSGNINPQSPPNTCSGLITLGSNYGSCPATVQACVPAGEYFIFVGTADAAGNGLFQGVPCGSGLLNEYSMKVTGTAADCPALVSTQCASPGPDTVVVGLPQTAPFGGLVACAVAPPNVACGLGGTTINRYARVVPAAQVLDELSCLTVGVFSVRQGLNSQGACASFVSDIPLPATIGIYRDVNGGEPTNTFAADGTCGSAAGDCDLVLIEEIDVLVPGGSYKGVINLDSPVCLADVDQGQNLVIVMSTPNLAQGVPGVPGNSGYGIRPAGNTVVGEAPNTYVKLSCTGPDRFVLSNTLGASFTSNWAIELNGTAGSCPSSGNDCPADLNGDNVINGFDLSAVLAGWGSPAGDTNGDGTTNGIDITTILSAWNTTCP